MIQFFQKLKAKKGFTLVELIVVIAIIGVLAAILVPTMLGYVTNSRVTSADSTAASFAKEIDSFLTEADTSNYGMKKGVAESEFVFTISGGSWTSTISNAATSFNGTTTMAWAAAGAAATASTPKTAAAGTPGNVATLMNIQLAGLFPDIQDGRVVAYVVGGHVIACMYATDNTLTFTTSTFYNITPAAGNVPASLTNKVAVTGSFDASTAGVDANGNIIGTSPKLTIV